MMCFRKHGLGLPMRMRKEYRLKYTVGSLSSYAPLTHIGNRVGIEMKFDTLSYMIYLKLH